MTLPVFRAAVSLRQRFRLSYGDGAFARAWITARTTGSPNPYTPVPVPLRG